MISFPCQKCDRELKDKDEICLMQNGSDNLHLTCVGPWAKDKHYYLDTYLNTVVMAMKDKWNSNLTYIDLFAGPGRSMVYTTGEEIDGSPIIALKSRIPFKKYILIDKSKSNVEILKLRCQNNKNFSKVEFIRGDCNKNIGQINPIGLSVTFIDPFGINFDFISLQKLTSKRPMDLLINFPIGAIKRNLEKLLYKENTVLDRFLGDDKWKKSYRVGHSKTDFFINYYRKKVEELGYIYDTTKVLSDQIPIRNNVTKTIMYYLIYFTKHPRGIDLFNKATKYGPSGQPTLPFV